MYSNNCYSNYSLKAVCKFTGKCNDRVLHKPHKSEILGLFSMIHVAMKTVQSANKL